MFLKKVTLIAGNIKKYLGQSETAEPETKRVKTELECIHPEKTTLEVIFNRKNKPQNRQQDEIHKEKATADDVYAFVE